MGNRMLWLQAQALPLTGLQWALERKPSTFSLLPRVPPVQNEATSASTINRVAPKETSPTTPRSHPARARRGQRETLEADGSAQTSTTPPAAGASEPPRRQPGGANARARGQRARPRERAVSGARPPERGRAWARAWPRSSGAPRVVGVGVRARRGPRLCGLRRRARRRRPGSRGDARASRSGSGRFGADAGPRRESFGFAAARLAGARRFPGPERAAAPGDAR